MKFTIGLPITKTEYLKATLDGIRSQTYSDFEVVIKNNASTSEKKQEVKEICADWIKKDNVQYYESDQQLTMTQNFNTILNKAKGDYFLIMSDDDIMEPDFLKEFNFLIEKYPKANVFHCRVKRIDGEDNLIDFSENCPEWESQIDFVYQRLTGKRTLYLSDFVVKTRVLIEDGGFTELPKGWGIDEITWCKLGFNGIVFVPKILLRYRRFLGNFSLSKENLQGRFGDVEIMDSILNDIIKENCNDLNCIYPLPFLLKLNQLRSQKQKDYILSHYAKSNNFITTARFYSQNKDKLSFTGFMKIIAKKTFLKDRSYNAV